MKVVTGDSDVVARAVGEQVGPGRRPACSPATRSTDDDAGFRGAAETTTIFARVDPDQKIQVIRALQSAVQVVGYLGDGINDAPPLHAADVGHQRRQRHGRRAGGSRYRPAPAEPRGIAQGVREGRRTFANTLKYIRMGTSSNFGNMLSMAGAPCFLPFLPMLPRQILLNNLIYDASQIAIPTDDVDPETEAEPAPMGHRGDRAIHAGLRPDQLDLRLSDVRVPALVLHASEAEFHTGWFVESLATQVLVIFVIRTRRSPFWHSRPSRPWWPPQPPPSSRPSP